MRLSQVNKILLGSSIIVVPLSFYGGMYVKEYWLSRKLDEIDDMKPPPHERAMRARTVQLERERKDLMEEAKPRFSGIGRDMTSWLEK
ncbi:hypothetical protein L204_105577 [Cryptococcus depauperatus]